MPGGEPLGLRKSLSCCNYPIRSAILSAGISSLALLWKDLCFIFERPKKTSTQGKHLKLERMTLLKLALPSVKHLRA